MLAKVAKFTKQFQAMVQVLGAPLHTPNQSTKGKSEWPVFDFEQQTNSSQKMVLDERVEDPREADQKAKVDQKPSVQNSSAFANYEKKVEKEMKKSLHKIDPAVDNRDEESARVAVPNSEAFDPRADSQNGKEGSGQKKKF
jgi:hypothetical protein